MPAARIRATVLQGAPRPQLVSAALALKAKLEIHTSQGVSQREVVPMVIKIAQIKVSASGACARISAMTHVDQTQNAPSRTEKPSANVCRASSQARWTGELASETAKDAERIRTVSEAPPAKLDSADTPAEDKTTALLGNSAVTVCA